MGTVMARFTTRQIGPFKVEILRNGKHFDTCYNIIAAKIRIIDLELVEELHATN